MNAEFQVKMHGVVQALQSGSYKNAEALLDAILKVDLLHIEAIFKFGIACANHQRIGDALVIFSRLRHYSPDDARIPYNQGLLLSMQGNHEKALESYDLALKINPNDAESHINKGSIYNELKNYVAALNSLELAIQINSEIPELWLNKGIALNNLGQYRQALEAYTEAIRLNPNYAEAWFNKANIFNELKNYDEALTHYDKALSLKPDYAEAWSNKGNILGELKSFKDALAHYDKAVSIKPDYAEAWSNKGSILSELKCFDGALTHYDKALSLKPDYVEAWSNKATTHSDLRNYVEAIACFERALCFKPDIDWIYGDYLHAKMKVCSWKNIKNEVEKLKENVRSHKKISSPFPLLSLIDDPAILRECTEEYVQDKYPANACLGNISKRAKQEKIRIGYFSADFKTHPVAFLTAELFEIHDRSKFEIFAFSLGMAAPGDQMRARLKSSFDHFLDLEGKSDLEIAKLARELKIDIAVDLSGFTQDARTGIFSYRAAPIQVNYLGYPGTLGASYMDYIVADDTIIPAFHQIHYIENVAYLPHSYMVDDSKRVASTRIFTRQECGLPENAFVFCSFNNSYKLNEEMIDCWSRILLDSDNSVLWLSEGDEMSMTNLKNKFASNGIDSRRIIFAKRVELMNDHLARYVLADMFLDTIPYNAHTTAVDCLKAKVPVITCIGSSFAGRVAASLLNAIYLPELITTTHANYESLAIELASNPEKLAAIKQKLANNRLSAPLFNTPLFAKHLEAAYISMMKRYWDDLPPAHIHIAP